MTTLYKNTEPLQYIPETTLIMVKSNFSMQTWCAHKAMK